MSAFAKRFLLAGFAAGAVVLGGCGGEAPKAKGPIYKGVYTSASDCAGGGHLTIDACSALIERGIAEHERTAPTYNSQKSCEAAEGADKCERSATNKFRPRLSAFMVLTTEPPTIRPLYPTLGGENGFRTADKTVIKADDESLNFSLGAQSLAEAHVAKKGKSKKGG